MLFGDCSNMAIPSAIRKKEHETLVTLVVIRALGTVSPKLSEWLIHTTGEAHGPSGSLLPIVDDIYCSYCRYYGFK